MLSVRKRGEDLAKAETALAAAIASGDKQAQRSAEEALAKERAEVDEAEARHAELSMMSP